MWAASKRGLAGLALAAWILAAAAFAGAEVRAESGAEPAGAAAPQCRKAEVNPVTGHVLCLDPLGAPVDPPPPAAELPCKPGARTDEAWSYGPKCKASGSGS
jgi:hypothetical protein